MNKNKVKIVRITTISNSLRRLLKGQLRFMNKTFNVIGVSSEEGGAIDEVEAQEGIRVVPIKMSRSLSPFKDIISLWNMYFFLKKEKPLIVHTHTPKAGTIGMLAAKMAGIPYRLHTIAGLPLLEATGIKRTLLNNVEKVTYACATKIYPNSYGLKDIIIDQKFTKHSKLKVIGNGSSNGIDTTFFNKDEIPENTLLELKNNLDIDPHNFVYIYVGRMVRDKGIYELVDAFIEIHKKHPTAILLLVGKILNDHEPLRKETIDYINNHEAIRTVGYQPDVRPYFAISDVLVFPSYREGFPNVVLQAGSMGLNSIVTDINGCNEIVKNDVNGYIIPVKNRVVLQDKMEYVMLHTEKNAEMGIKSRVTICKNYDQHYLWNELMKEYKSLLT